MTTEGHTPSHTHSQPAALSHALDLSFLLGTQSHSTGESPHVPVSPSRPTASSWWALKPPWGHDAKLWGPRGLGLSYFGC